MNLASIIDPHPESATALVQGDRRVSYGELRSSVASARAALVGLGVGDGHRVALVVSAGVEFVVAYLAVLGVGAVAVPVNPQSPPAELEQELESVRPSLVLAGPAEGQIAARLVDLGHEVIAVAALAEAGDLAGARRDHTAIVDRAPDDPAALLFTSGTAGFPKAAVLTHGSLLANIEQMELRVGTAATAEDVVMVLLPTFHIFGLNAVIGVQLFVGGVAVLVERFDPATVLGLAKAEGVTILPAVPPAFAALADSPDSTGDELVTVRLAISGAAPLPAEIAERFEARFSVPLWQGYGLTEASPAVTFPDTSRPHDATSVGTPLPGVELRLVDADGGEVEAGDPGEIWVRGPNVFAGYFEDDAATAAVLDSSGWLHTGDVAIMDDRGALSIVDRHKDLIIVSGFNVFPAEVEQVLSGHPGVVEAAVIGVPDAAHGEAVQAFVVPEPELWSEDADGPDPLDASELVQHCARFLARYKCPASVSFVRELPRSAHGKALRRALR